MKTKTFKSVSRRLIIVFVIFLLFLLPMIPAFAATNTDVAGAVTTAFNTYGKPQMKNLANNVIFPIIDGIILIAMVARFAFVEFQYRKNGGHFEWGALAVLGGCLLFMVTVPLWGWKVIGW